jgi:8-oxo-dGTP pyrophosphatase MutT (NUDIX family)
LIGAAAREAKEELGIEPLSLVYIGKKESVVESGTWTDDHFQMQVELDYSYLPGWSPRFINGNPCCESLLGDLGIVPRSTITPLTDAQLNRILEAIS